MSKQPLDIAIAVIESSRRDLVSKEEQRVAASKGKARATQEDDDREADYRRNLEEYNQALSEVHANREKQIQEVKAKNYHNPISIGPSIYGQSDAETASFDAASDILSDKEPFLNPFTGSLVFPETVETT